MDSKARKWVAREVDWQKDSGLLRRLYNNTWHNHAISETDYFEWNLIKNWCGKAIAFCAEPTDRRDLIAGVYLVLPNRLWLNNKQMPFGVSLYTMTHPLYYKQGIFNELAALTYSKCQEIGIEGVVGVPNNNSLPGFIKSLKFDVIGQFDLLVKFISPIPIAKHLPKVAVVTDPNNLDAYDFRPIVSNNQTGNVFFDRCAEFYKWRFFDCPKFNYQIGIVADSSKKVLGLIAYRKAFKKKVPVTVIMDFIIDKTYKGNEEVSRALLGSANKYAICKMAPFIIALSNADTIETKLMSHSGFKVMSKRVLPHESNFILKILNQHPDFKVKEIARFRDWYFSFSDYDIF